MPLLPETKEVLLRLSNGRASNEPIFMSRPDWLSHEETYIVAKDIIEVWQSH